MDKGELACRLTLYAWIYGQFRTYDPYRHENKTGKQSR